MGINRGHWRCSLCKTFVGAARRLEFEGDFYHLGLLSEISYRTGFPFAAVLPSRVGACGPVEPALAAQEIHAHLSQDHSEGIAYLDWEDISFSRALRVHAWVHNVEDDLWLLGADHREIQGVADFAVKGAKGG